MNPKIESKRTSTKTYGGNTKPTIYYIVGHAGKIAQYRLHIRYLVSRGFRVMAFEYDPKVLMSGDPQRLLMINDELKRRISEDMSGRTVAGVYGVSLGTFLGMNVMTANGIKKGLFNTGPANLVKVVWDVTGFAPVKTAFMEQGVSRKELEAAWRPMELPAIVDGLQDAQFIFMNSYDDTIITADNWQASLALLNDKGIDAKVLTSRWLGHVTVIIRNLFRLRTAGTFFK